MSVALCESICASLVLSNLTASIDSCGYYAAGSTINVQGAQATCLSVTHPQVDVCRVGLSVATSDSSENYMEVWLPTDWNGRYLATDNKGLNGCVGYNDMAYTSSMGFAVSGDNAGHNATSYDGTDFENNNAAIVDWSYRSRHVAVVATKQVIEQYYGTPQNYSYFLGCSTGGRQGLKSAQVYPNDFNGIIAGSPASDVNHLFDWSGRFYLITGFGTDDRAMSEDQWGFVHEHVLDQCDEVLDGVADGILEDSSICDFNATVLRCGVSSDTRCLTSTQVTAVRNVYSQLYDQQGTLLFPRLSPGTEVDAAADGTLTGSVQALTHDWFAYAVYNDKDWDPKTLGQADYTLSDNLDEVHGYVSTNSGDLSAFRAAGGKLIVHHGMQDHVITGEQSMRYYIHVAQTMGITHGQMDQFFRFFRISGAGHCAVGDGAWMFGQNGLARAASDNIINDLVNWVENGDAPDTLTGTKFVNDDSSQGIAFERPHCRFPYRTTYDGVGDPNITTSWTCEYISTWRHCGAGNFPRLC
ncbi:hypothetical protein AAFC00_003883 [Neodothiora populina]|uniref:Carboxylic ester hydrolase n=1 Tax=Neodothiora populina TaxID=2781224 RepID=A0ABR3PFP6_9PEZI